jgi:hypothetical protein
MATTAGGGSDTTLTSQTEAFLLNTATITIKDTIAIDLTAVIDEIEIFEDIFKPSITGSITINDFVGGLEKYAFTGGEILKIKVSMPSDGNITVFNRDNLIVHEFSKINADSTGNLKYKLYFTSDSALNSLKRRVFKSFGATRGVSDIANVLYQNMSSDGTSTKIKINASPDRLTNTFLSPGYTPIDAINNLAKRSSSDGKYYLFFERLNYSTTGEVYHHYFTSIDDIITKWTDFQKISGNQLPTIKYNPASAYFTTTKPEYNIRAKTVQYENNYNHLSSMVGGFYNSRIRSLNLLTRRYTDTYINYKDNVDSSGVVYTNKFIETSNYFATYDTNEYPGERLVVAPMNDSFSKKNEWIKNDTYGAFLNSNIRIIVDIAGGTNRLGAGDIIDLRLPSRMYKAVNIESSATTDDALYSGKYIITACRHNLSKLGYTKKLELSRGNFTLNLDNLISRTQPFNGF